VKPTILVLSILVAASAACLRSPSVSPTLSPAPTTESTQPPSVSAGAGAQVAYVENGNLLVWDEATGGTQTIFDGGDVIGVGASDDGQVLAFLRRSVVQLAEEPWTSWREQSALWAIGRDGGDPRELESAEALRSLQGAAESESTNIPYMAWIPGTHRLLYSAWTYIVQAEGESHAVPEGLFLVDADTGSAAVLMPAGNTLRFVPSPDAQQIALLSPTGLGFINVDGSNLRPDVLTYPGAGLTGPLFPTGVWVQDSRAFVITGSLEQDPEFNISFTLQKVPVDGSPPEVLATIPRSDPRSVTFSPDGRQAAFVQFTDGEPSGLPGWSIIPLPVGVCPLAIPQHLDPFFWGAPAVHWSPDGRAFNGKMWELCPDATTGSEVCETMLSYDGSVAAIQWLDALRFLFLTREPSVLFLVTQDSSGRLDDTTVPIVAWPLEEFVGLNGFAAIRGNR